MTPPKNIKHVRSKLLWKYCVVDNADIFNRQTSILPSLLRPQKNLIITTPTVFKLYWRQFAELLKGKNISAAVEVIEVSESSKSISLVESVCHLAKKHAISRMDMLVGFGGGSCTDIVTMAASWLYRGIKYIKIPTTLIGQVDAGIGIKGSLNFENCKSNLGCFYQPECVPIDYQLLRTLPKIYLQHGFVEILKMAMVSSSKLFQLTETYASNLIASQFSSNNRQAQEIISLSIKKMLDELEINFYERNSPKRLVDFGHTISPLIESISNFTIPHGEAVAIDIALCSIFALLTRNISDAECDRILKTLCSFGLKINSKLLSVELCMQAFANATKNRGQLNLVIPNAIGSAIFIETADSIPVIMIQEAIKMLSIKIEEQSIYA